MKPYKTHNQGRTKYFMVSLQLDVERDADLLAEVERTPYGQLSGKVREMMRNGLRPEVKFNGQHTPDVELDGIGGDI